MATQRPPPYPSQFQHLSTAEYRYLVDAPYDWNNTLIDTNSLAKFNLANISAPFLPRHAMSSLGRLDSVPTEIICMILGRVDLSSLMNLGATNTTLRCVINNWLPFREVMTGGADVLRALLATKAAVMFTVPQISTAIFTTRCELCGECGTFLQLVKLARCCFRCLANDRRLLSVPLSFAQVKMGFNPQLLSETPHLVTIPRATFWGTQRTMPSFHAVDYTSALRLVQPCPVRTVDTEVGRHLSELPTIIRRRHQKAQAIHQRWSRAAKRIGREILTRPLSSYPITTVQPLLAEADINPLENDMFRFLSAIHAPGRSKATMFDPQTETCILIQNVEYHGYCSGCRGYWNLISPHHPREHTIYTKPEIEAHLQTCFYARMRWNQLYPEGRPLDRVITDDILNRHPAPVLRRHNFPGIFEMISAHALHLYAKSTPTDKGYGDILLGSCDANSQATWATSGRNAAGSLWRYVDEMVERKCRKGDVRAWVNAATLQLRRPRMINRVRCEKGLPTTSSFDPDHTEIYHLNGQDVGLWFENDQTRYFQKWFLDTLSHRGY